jgi:hypothetical protein
MSRSANNPLGDWQLPGDEHLRSFHELSKTLSSDVLNPSEGGSESCKAETTLMCGNDPLQNSERSPDQCNQNQSRPCDRAIL